MKTFKEFINKQETKKDIKKHMNRMSELLGQGVKELNKRRSLHDQSKFSDEELIPLEKLHALKTNDEEKRAEILKPMYKHHYPLNRHHPEHFENGVDGMNLFDVMEMFFDWKADSEEDDEGFMNIKDECKRYNVSPQLENIIRNTAKTLGYKTDKD